MSTGSLSAPDPSIPGAGTQLGRTRGVAGRSQSDKNAAPGQTGAIGRPCARRVPLRPLVAPRPAQETRWQRFERARALPTPCTGRLLGEGEAAAALLQDTRRAAGDRLPPGQTGYPISCHSVPKLVRVGVKAAGRPHHGGESLTRREGATPCRVEA